MLHLIPQVKQLVCKDGFLKSSSVRYDIPSDARLAKALEKLPASPNGAELILTVSGSAGEGYALWVEQDRIRIDAQSPAGAFYAIQTLRQLFSQGDVPCLYIQDEPDFAYRGFYHDVTRGRVPRVETILELVEQMAYYKLNSLQLYVEHTYEFAECRELNGKTGYLTAQELQQIDTACQENFIEFIPSLSTFGHMYEILEQPAYRHLQVIKDKKALRSPVNFWDNRMGHHTIDPLNPESFHLICSLIDQYAPNFSSSWFNICCDETFDLRVYEGREDVGRVYVDFVKKIAGYVTEKKKKVMMWADILLKYPETITQLPEDVLFLNWSYGPNPPEQDIARFATLGRHQIVCPGTSTWNRLCEKTDQEEQNICKMIDYGKRYGAVGVLNTNWGDWGNPCSLGLAMYGMVLGAAKSWTTETVPGADFYGDTDVLLYGKEGATALLARLSDLHNKVSWLDFCRNYFAARFDTDTERKEPLTGTLDALQNDYLALAVDLDASPWINENYRREMILAAQGVCLLAELSQQVLGRNPKRLIDTKEWLTHYREGWLAQNKESELGKIEEMLSWCEAQ